MLLRNIRESKTAKAMGVILYFLAVFAHFFKNLKSGQKWARLKCCTISFMSFSVFISLVLGFQNYLYNVHVVIHSAFTYQTN
jgi:hypothetical protein